MPRHVAFLRGMNLGNRRIKNEELRGRFEQLGFADVATFRASGNVVFAAGEEDSLEELVPRIEAGLAASLGYAVPVFARSAAEVAGIAACEPFGAHLVEASAGKLQVGLLTAKPRTRVRQLVLDLSTEADRLALYDRELYWLPSGGTLASELDLRAIARILGPMTMRTKGTVDQLVARFFAD
jgi:uncharacterized protein (DUF1697 family)